MKRQFTDVAEQRKNTLKYIHTNDTTEENKCIVFNFFSLWETTPAVTTDFYPLSNVEILSCWFIFLNTVYKMSYIKISYK